jgi:hypothetical protein
MRPYIQPSSDTGSREGETIAEIGRASAFRERAQVSTRRVEGYNCGEDDLGDRVAGLINVDERRLWRNLEVEDAKGESLSLPLYRSKLRQRSNRVVT